MGEVIDVVIVDVLLVVLLIQLGEDVAVEIVSISWVVDDRNDSSDESDT